MSDSIFKDGTELTVRMSDMASQENHDGEEYDLLVEGANRIKELEAKAKTTFLAGYYEGAGMNCWYNDHDYDGKLKENTWVDIVWEKYVRCER